MKHKHYDMIVAKAANFDLILFINLGGSWQTTGSHDNQTINISSHYDYFLCLPQHNKEGQCLHWLNGGEAQRVTSAPEAYVNLGEVSEWEDGHIFMNPDVTIRIKPRKEKRWIGYCANTNQTFPHPQSSREVAEDFAARSYGYTLDKWQFIEIEVEI